MISSYPRYRRPRAEASQASFEWGPPVPRTKRDPRLDRRLAVRSRVRKPSARSARSAKSARSARSAKSTKSTSGQAPGRPGRTKSTKSTKSAQVDQVGHVGTVVTGSRQHTPRPGNSVSNQGRALPPFEARVSEALRVNALPNRGHTRDSDVRLGRADLGRALRTHATAGGRPRACDGGRAPRDARDRGVRPRACDGGRATSDARDPDVRFFVSTRVAGTLAFVTSSFPSRSHRVATMRRIALALNAPVGLERGRRRQHANCHDLGRSMARTAGPRGPRANAMPDIRRTIWRLSRFRGRWSSVRHLTMARPKRESGRTSGRTSGGLGPDVGRTIIATGPISRFRFTTCDCRFRGYDSRFEGSFEGRWSSVRAPDDGAAQTRSGRTSGRTIIATLTISSSDLLIATVRDLEVPISRFEGAGRAVCT